MAFKMRAGPEGPMVKNFGGAFKHPGCRKHKHPHFRNTVRTSGCSKKDKVKKAAGFVGKVGALIGIGKFAKNKLDNM
jgi:hypothetical protein